MRSEALTKAFGSWRITILLFVCLREVTGPSFESRLLSGARTQPTACLMRQQEMTCGGSDPWCRSWTKNDGESLRKDAKSAAASNSAASFGERAGSWQWLACAR